MIVEGGHALELALGLWRAPARVAQARHRPLPEDLLPLLQLAAGDEELAAQAALATGESPQVLQEASIFFLQQVLFAPGADHYRVLGVPADAPEERIKQHYRWLVRWLHPDRNHDELERQYADRVNRAWQELRQPARRADYDRLLAAGPRPASDDELWGDAAPVPAAVFSDEPAPAPELMSPDAARRLPWLALGGLAGAAAVALSLMWLLQPPGRSGGEGLAPPPAAALPSLGSAPAAAAAEPAPAATAPPVPPAATEAPSPAVMDTLASAPTAPSAGPEVPGAGALDAKIPERGPGADPISLARAAGDGPPAGASPSAGLRLPAPATDAVRTAPAAASRPAAPAPPAPALRGAARPVPSPAPPAATAAPAGVARETGARAVTPSAAPSIATSAPAAAASVAAEPVAAPSAPVAPSEEEARAVLAAFSQAYGAGDINALMRLFTRDARNNRGGRDAIVYDYQSLFDASESRGLALETVAWVADGDRAMVLARYEAQVQRTGQRRSQRSRGDIRFELRREGGVPRILQVRHDTD